MATGVFLFHQTNPPQNLRLDGYPLVCGATDTRTLMVDAASDQSTRYNWRIVSGNGNFGGFSSAQGGNNIDLTFAGSGTAVVEVTAQDNCNRLSEPATKEFATADPNAVPLPLPATLLDGYYSFSWSYSPSAVGKIPVSAPQSGIAYSFLALGTELFNVKQPTYPGATVSYYPGDPKAPAGSGYVQLGPNTGGSSTTITILSDRVASATVRVTASNGCGANGQLQSRDYYLTRPFNGSGLHRFAKKRVTNPARIRCPGFSQTRSATSCRLYPLRRLASIAACWC